MTHDRTLVVFAGAIGDFILACPALSALDRQSLFDLIAPPDRAALARAASIARETHTFESVPFHTAYTEPSTTLREFLKSYRRCVTFLGDDLTLRENLRRCGVDHVETHPGKPPVEWTHHASRFYADRLHLNPPDDFGFRVKPARTRYDIVIHPGSGSQKKNWPIEKFIETAQLLQDSGREITWSIGPAEHEAGLPAALPADAQFLPQQSLHELAATFAAANVYVGNDSGITHLAAATGCQSLALFGPTNPEVWAPRGEHVRVLKNMDNVIPQQVADWARRLVETD